MPPWASALRALSALSAVLLVLPGCHLLAPPGPSPAGQEESVSYSNPIPEPAPRKAKGHDPEPRWIPSEPQVQHLHMLIDSGSSTGLIALVLDPGPLNPRRAATTCALKGHIAATVTTFGNGKRSFTIERISLASASDGRLRFSWSPLVGSIRTLIPAGILTIKDHTLPPAIPVRRDGSFSQPDCHFRVGGTCQVRGSGIILAGKVGKTVEDLTIGKTEPVTLTGSLVRRKGRWILHIPAAIMTDRFEIDDDGTSLDLNFTGNITAIAE